MQTNVMMKCNFKFNPVESTMDFRQMTVGDRLDWLLKFHGRRDRQHDYSQYDLTDFLTGAATAPNGKAYAIRTNRSTVNRYVTNKQQMPYEVITVVCEIFHVSADWLLRGEESGETVKDSFYSDEANHVGAMVDAMSYDYRQLMILIGERLLSADERQNNSDLRIAELLQENIRLLSNGHRPLADAYIERTDQNRRRLKLYQPQKQ